jgi:hypothetical protein
MKQYQKMGLSFLLLIIFGAASSSPALSQSEAGSWFKRRLTHNAGASVYPTIAVSGNNVHVVWYDDTPGNFEVFYRGSGDNGVSWGNKTRFTRNAGSSKFPAIAVSDSNVHVVWMNYRPAGAEIYYRRSVDNGATWEKTKRLTNTGAYSFRPAITVWGNNIHVVWYENLSGNYEIYYKRSITNGATWGKTKRLTHNAGESSFPAIAVSGNNVHVIWADDSSGKWQFNYKRSLDNGVTWSKTNRFKNNARDFDNLDIAVSGSNVHVVWYDETHGAAEIYYRRSSDDGATWGAKKRLTYNAGGSYAPAIAASGGIVHVVWSDRTPGNYEIFSRLSSDNGASWGKRMRLTHNAEASWAPDTAVSGGALHVVWHDSKPGNDEIFYKRGP